MIKCNCDISVCHARCCYNVPIPKGYLSAHKKKIVNPILRVERLGEHESLGGENVMPFTSEDKDKNKCPFLREDCKCNIYSIRPRVCRDFGTMGDVNNYMRCSYLSGKSSVLTIAETEGAYVATALQYLRNEL